MFPKDLIVHFMQTVPVEALQEAWALSYTVCFLLVVNGHLRLQLSSQGIAAI